MSLEERLEEQIRRNEQYLKENEEIVRRTGGGNNDNYTASDDDEGCGIPLILVFVVIVSFISQIRILSMI